MRAFSHRPEIDHRTIKLLVGLIALSLASITNWFSVSAITSISASYYEGDWARNALVGSLFAIAALMLAYNGLSFWEMLLSKLGALAALGVAMFPCACGGHAEIWAHAHYLSATLMFSVLAGMCRIFQKRASRKRHIEARRRAGIYFLCMLVILGVMAIMLIDAMSQDVLSAEWPRLTFYCERAGLVAFAVSWLTASKIIPVFAAPEERLRLLPARVGVRQAAAAAADVRDVAREGWREA